MTIVLPPEDDLSLIIVPSLMIRLPPVEIPPLRIVPPEMLIVPPLSDLSLKIVPYFIMIGPLVEMPPLIIDPPFITRVLYPFDDPLPEDDPLLMTEPPLITRLTPVAVAPLNIVPVEMFMSIFPPSDELSLVIVPPFNTSGPPVD